MSPMPDDGPLQGRESGLTLVEPTHISEHLILINNISSTQIIHVPMFRLRQE